MSFPVNKTTKTSGNDFIPGSETSYSHGPYQPYCNAIVTYGNFGEMTPGNRNASLNVGTKEFIKVASNTIDYFNNGASEVKLTFGPSNIHINCNTTLQVSKLQVNQITYNLCNTQLNGSNIVISNSFGGTFLASNGASLYYGVASSSNISERNGPIAISDVPDNKNELVVFGQLFTEASRAKSAESSLTVALSTEVSRAQSAESSLTVALSTEVSRAQSAESSLTVALSTEVSRAQSAEDSLQTLTTFSLNRIDNLELGIEYFHVLNVGSNYNAESETSFASLTITDNGDLTTQGSITSYSDMRLKTDITTLSNALDIVTHMRPVTYVWNNGHSTTNPAFPELGLIAQEVEAVMPNVVVTSSNAVLSDLKSVAYDRLVALLIGAVTELSAKVDALSK